MKQSELRFRQIHLDFHTHQSISGIGSDFDPEEFAATLEAAHVNSINLFARGHHGYNYYYSKKFPELAHPHLERDLLREQIDACHARGIRTPIYITVGWDQVICDQHPEWRVVEPNGRMNGPEPYQDGFWHNICLNSPYKKLLKERFEDVLTTFAPVDGLWLDIIQVKDCSCTYCKQGMLDAGLDPSDPIVRRDYGWKVLHSFKREMSEFIRGIQEDCLIFYNAGHIGPHHRSVAEAYTHFEIESLPTGGWGYKHFDMVMLYARTLGLNSLGMTGKFHTMWGDFHSFKNQVALEYECFKMLALGAKCCVGDQLHPTGKICQTTYKLIGSVYSEVAKREPWCSAVKPVTEIGVFSPEEFDLAHGHPMIEGDSGKLRPILGTIRILQEAGHQFDIIDSQSDLRGYKLLILPDNIPMDETFATKLEDFLAQGGSLIASYASGMNSEKTKFVLDALGVSLSGEGEQDLQGELVRGKYYPHHNYVDYLLPGEGINTGLEETEYVMYMRGMHIAAKDQTQVLTNMVAPYFDRTYRHYMSHRQTPSSRKVDGPGIVQHGRCIYFVHPIFSQYQANAPRWCKQFILNAIQRLLPEPLIRTNAPSTALVSVNAQEQHHRWIVHLLHYIPERRNDLIDIIEDVIPLYKIEVSVKTGQAVKKVTCVPAGEELDFRLDNGRDIFIVPKIEGHQMIELSFV